MLKDIRLFLALPVLNEYENLRDFLQCLKQQNENQFLLVVCVNQVDSWWDDPPKVSQCLNNQDSLNLLASEQDIRLEVLDYASKGKGWKGKHGGVGWARKVAMDRINQLAEPDDIIISMDADTYYPPDYLSAIKAFLQEDKACIGLSIPYYHRLGGDEKNNRLILRYELYMRYYAHNMLRIHNPYAYTALGSAIALPAWAYRKINGITPVKSGEDFYLLQKLVKNGKLCTWVETTAYPSSRFSDRVLFGTGPALIKGNAGDWTSYPFYNYHDFNEVEETFSSFPSLYYEEGPTPMDSFLKDQFGTSNLWKPLRENYKDRKNFVRACRNKVDGLRILQFLRWKQASSKMSEEAVLTNYLHGNAATELNEEVKSILKKFNFEVSSIGELDSLRQWFFLQEQKLRKVKDERSGDV